MTAPQVIGIRIGDQVTVNGIRCGNSIGLGFIIIFIDLTSFCFFIQEIGTGRKYSC